ncbi:UNVERIFIED_CONTAM: hypothetical protein K2H54_052606, partial [Gekko kuhli]
VLGVGRVLVLVVREVGAQLAVVVGAPGPEEQVGLAVLVVPAELVALVGWELLVARELQVAALAWMLVAAAPEPAGEWVAVCPPE